jgi:hypothetical protein
MFGAVAWGAGARKHVAGPSNGTRNRGEREKTGRGRKFPLKEGVRGNSEQDFKMQDFRWLNVRFEMLFSA